MSIFKNENRGTESVPISLRKLQVRSPHATPPSADNHIWEHGCGAPSNLLLPPGLSNSKSKRHSQYVMASSVKAMARTPFHTGMLLGRQENWLASPIPNNWNHGIAFWEAQPSALWNTGWTCGGDTVRPARGGLWGRGRWHTRHNANARAALNATLSEQPDVWKSDGSCDECGADDHLGQPRQRRLERYRPDAHRRQWRRFFSDQ